MNSQKQKSSALWLAAVTVSLLLAAPLALEAKPKHDPQALRIYKSLTPQQQARVRKAYRKNPERTAAQLKQRHRKAKAAGRTQRRARGR